MRKLSQGTMFIGVIFLSMVMLSACASTPQPQSQPGQTPGHYKNDEYRFTVEYPDHYVMQRLERDEVFHVANPNQWKIPVFTVNISDAKAEEKLDAQAYVGSVKKTIPGSKRYKVLSEEMVTLNDGTLGLKMFFKYTLPDSVTKLQTASMWILKDGKSMSTNATTILGGDTTPDKLLEMVSSIKFF